MIFRHDDVSPATDMKKLTEIHDFLKEEFPECQIWSCVNILAKHNEIGAVYPNLPIKDRSKEYLYNVDTLLSVDELCDLDERKQEMIVSHGLIHGVHSRFSQETQEFSILTSCNLLDTKIFVPPFNAYNEDTVSICERNNIRLAKPSDGWKSIETTPFDKEHKLWFFHSWRYKTSKEFIDSVLNSKTIAGNGSLWWVN